jgi:hypothetical protein
MADAAFVKGVSELYQGELLGEVLLGGLLKTAENDEQRYKLGTMLQLETETKARLRPLAFRYGLDLAEDAAVRTEGLSAVETLSPLSWHQKMQTIHDIIRDRYIPRYTDPSNSARTLRASRRARNARTSTCDSAFMIAMGRRGLSGGNSRPN